MNGQEVYKFAVKEVPLIFDNLFKKLYFTHSTDSINDGILFKLSFLTKDIKEASKYI